ncbi:PQQ-dependent sugar dehydrogenase [Salinicoccus siamensis]|uniref:PQQ-dependent sugar dehydrogenase n=1 Tax=Salinicoccus siamensis TaxID=381830 RepID=A0ABV5Z3U1_9STAP
MKKVFMLGVLMLAACGTGESGTSVESEAEDVATDLKVPWMVVEAGEGFIVSEREGGLKQITEGRVTDQPLELNIPIHASGEGGLLGFILHPDDPDTAFIYHTYFDGGEKNRVVELKREEGTWRESDVLIADIPGGRVHNGGRMEIGPDGDLYITTGDAGNGEYSQDIESLAGKILRIGLDGSLPEDNPFGNEVYSYGHRNPQGIAWNDEGTMYAAEHGSDGHDEINRIEPGANYGWPLVEGDEEQEGMKVPLYHTGNDTWAPSGISHAAGTLYIAALRGTKIIALDLETLETSTQYDEGSRMRDVHIKDGSIYALTNNTDGRGDPGEGDDRLIRITMDE